MSYDPIIEGSEATPGLWNRRMQSVWSSLNTLSSSSGTEILYSGVTGVRSAAGWYIAAPVGTSLLSLGAVQGQAVLSFGTYFGVYASPGANPLLQISPLGGSGVGRFSFTGNAYSEFSGDGSLSMVSNLWIGSSPAKVVGVRQTGWASVPTGTPIRTTFVTSTATLGDVAQRLAALIIDLTAHGLIGP
jgi:hypothetical protein